MHAGTIVGYLFAADLLCPGCVVEVLIGRGEASPAARDMRVEDALDQIAAANGVDRVDESSFDSDEFPKVVFASMLEDDEGACGFCGGGLLD